MADGVIPFDQVVSDTGGSIDNSSMSSVIPFDQVDSDVSHSELRGVLNQTLRGGISGLSLVDELLPQISRSESGIGLKADWPHLFGLGSTPSGYESLQDVGTRGLTDVGVMNTDQPQTQFGKLAGNVGENAASAALFGPAAMAASGAFGGLGGYAGEAAFGSTGRTIGSLAGNLSPAGIRKLGLIKEIGEQLGPTVSQLPVLRELFAKVGVNPIQSAVGRALSNSAEDLPEAEKALQTATDFIGPQTELNSLKTTAEVAADKGLARVEDAVQSAVPGAPFKSIAEERAGLRAGEVMENYDPKTSAYDVSKGLEQKIADSAENVKAVEDATWKALPKDAPVNTNLGNIQDELANQIDDITYSGALEAKGEAGALLNKYKKANTEGLTSLGVIQDLRSKALQIARSTKNATNVEDRVAHKVANALSSHFDDLIDANVATGGLPQDAADIWRGSRALTKAKINTFGAPVAGTQNAGTKALEQLALKGQSLDNTQLLREGLSSPDKLAAHIAAAKAGGQDVRPLYQQALKSELDGAPQSKWADIIDKKRAQWEQVFSPEEMTNLDKNLADIEASRTFENSKLVGNSATNPRGNVQRAINSEKGLAAVGSGFQSAATLGATISGAKYGWDKAETTPGGIANALLYGAGGALLGKGFKGATSAASAKFDEVLINALKNPGEALSAIKAAKSSGFGKALAESTTNAALAGGSRVGGSLLNKLLNSTLGSRSDNSGQPETPLGQALSTVLNKQGTKMDNVETPKILGANRIEQAQELQGKPVSAVMDQIKKDPIDHAIMLMESSSDPKAKNPDSSASGLFQLTKGTAEKLGVKDVFDPAENYQGYLKLKEENSRFGTDPQMVYAAHYLGAPTLSKWLTGKSLTETEQAQVRELKTVLLPRLMKIYNGLVEA